MSYNIEVYHPDNHDNILSNDFTVILTGYGLESYSVKIPYITLRNGALTLHEQYPWDGATWALDTPAFLLPAAVHDALYKLISLGHLPPSFRKQADQILYALCLKFGMNKIRATYVFYAVRILGAPFAKRPDKQRYTTITIPEELK